MRQRPFPGAACCLAIGTFRALQKIHPVLSQRAKAAPLQASQGAPPICSCEVLGTARQRKGPADAICREQRKSSRRGLGYTGASPHQGWVS
jgi:hypothetical protein